MGVFTTLLVINVCMKESDIDDQDSGEVGTP